MKVSKGIVLTGPERRFVIKFMKITIALEKKVPVEKILKTFVTEV
jgi:hypothetical protein